MKRLYKSLLLILIGAIAVVLLQRKSIEPIQDSRFYTENHPESHPWIVAHRCGAGLYPENTVFACQRTWQNGYADMLEIDVRLTADDQLIVIHDDSVDRTTDGAGKVRDFTMPELKTLDAGYRFTKDGKTYPFRGKGIRIPTLRKLFDALPSEALFMIEIKAEDVRAAARALQYIRSHGRIDRVILGSAFHSVNGVIYREQPTIPVFASESEILLWFAAYMLDLNGWVHPRYDTMALPIRWKNMRLSLDIIKEAKRHRFHVFLWTVNDPKSLPLSVARNIDGLITDYPDRFGSYRQREKRKGPN